MTRDDDVTTGESSQGALGDPGRFSRRRGLLLAGTGFAGLVVGASATEAANVVTGPDQVMEPVAEISPSEDLMREHGVLKRILLIYGEAASRLTAGRDLPVDSLHQAAQIVHEFIEGFHEGLEEGYVFPPLRRAGKLGHTVNTLLIQHARGRSVTQRVLATATDRRLQDSAVQASLAQDLRVFVRMYGPHEAREDTVVFPTFRAITPVKAFAQLGEQFADLERKRFGNNGFTDIVTRVAQIERSFGIYDLAQFTPQLA